MNLLYYLAEANVYLGVFYLAYCLLLTKETHYQLNRAYLLFSCVIAFILPVLQIGALKPVHTAVNTTINYTVPNYVVQDYEALDKVAPVKNTAKVHVTPTPTITKKTPVVSTTSTTVEPTVIEQHHLTQQDYIIYTYLLGAAILFLVLMVKILSLFKLIRNAQRIDKGKHQLIYLSDTNVAFSFFNYLFIGTNAPGANTIIRHELVHIRQKHSVDIIFLELLKIINWFNPFVYLLQNSLKTVHEYIADEKTAAYDSDPLTYSSFLVNNAYGAGNTSITHSFFNYNLLKKRIIMLNQQRSGNLARLKYLVVAPICAGLLCASTFAFSKTYALVDLDPAATVFAKPIHQNQPNKTATVADEPITLSATDNGDIARSGDKFEEVKVTPVTSESVVDEDHPPVPMESAGGYDKLNRHLLQNIHYKPTDGDKGGLVVVSFTIGEGRKITDLKIATSDGEALDNLALNAFKSYKGVVNDDEGKTLKMGVFFLTDDYSIFKRPFENDPGNSGWVTVTKYGFHPAMTSKGYEYAEWFTGGYMVDGKVTPTVAKVRFIDKNGQEVSYSADTATPDDSKLLKDKYGYIFPSNSYWATEGLKMARVHRYVANGMTLNSYLNKPYTDAFYQHILTDTKYPEKENDEGTAGIVLLKFNLDQNETISDWAVAKSGGDDFDQAALEVVKSFDGTIDDKAGAHTIAVVFCAVQNGKRPKVDESWKKTPGYVGEVARGESKPIMISFSPAKKQ